MIEIKRGAIFLDRDGVINYNRADHVKSWDEFEFLPG
jgi:D-glycero-D-manno-heptose 1,7-bisphosphate phosphatase